VGSLWRVVIVTNISCDGAYFAFQICKIFRTIAIDIILKNASKNYFKKLMAGEFGVRDHPNPSRKRQGLEIHFRSPRSNTNIKIAVIYLHFYTFEIKEKLSQ
jgi:hypothetical protein